MKWRARRRIALAFTALPSLAAACGFDLSGLGASPDGGGEGDAAVTSEFDAAQSRDAEGEAAPPPADASVAIDAALDAHLDGSLDVTDQLDAREATTPLSLRYNINGAAFVSNSAQAVGAWLADPGAGGVCGPSVHSVTTVYGTNDGPLYVGEVFGNPLVCSIGAGLLPAGSYDVTLHFAEIYFGPGCVGGGGGTGARIFDVSLEGVEVETDLDVFAIGKCIANSNGSGSPVIRKHRVVISDGTLDVSMAAAVNNAKISAIRLDGPL